KSGYCFDTDYDVTEVAIYLCDLTLNLRNTVSIGVETASATPQLIAHEVNGGLAELQERNPEEWGRLAGIGLALPGIVDTSDPSSPVLYAQNIGWDPVPVSELCTPGAVPISADNGAKAFARSEVRRGALANQPEETAIVALIGRGVGMGILEHGRVLRGFSSSAGELGVLTTEV